MSLSFFVDWGIITVSLANMILMSWLGLTVLLNTQRQTWGVWLAGLGLLLGALFFIAHTAILGYGLDLISQGLAFWWQVGWIPVVGLPWVWYTLILWYAGFWDDTSAPLHQRQRIWFRIATLLGISLFVLLLVANPLEDYEQAALLNPAGALSIADLPVIVVVFPIYSFLSVILSIDALRKPGPSRRVFGELARQRARPWLLGVSLIFLLISLLVAAILGLVVIWINAGTIRLVPDFLLRQSFILSLFDLIIASLIGLAVLLLGEAIVAYEIFTGYTLPRHGFLRQWRRAILLAGGFGVLVSFMLLINLREIYTILLSALLMTTFYALLSWRSYNERQRFIDDLRPFVAGPGLFDSLIAPEELDGKTQVQAPFNALCRDILDTQVGYLVPIGSIAPLVGPPLSFPPGKVVEFPGLAETVSHVSTATAIALPIDPDTHHGAIWAVPLWAARGQSGVLLLGGKRDGGLYSQEEMEIAQTSSERLMDTLATAEFSQRLMLLQRQRMVESQILDQQARRILHDEILPDLHTALLTLSSLGTRAQGAIDLLSSSHGKISELLRDMPPVTQPQLNKLGLVGALRQLVEIEMHHAFDSVVWDVDKTLEERMRGLSATTSAVVYYAAREAIRNAARHGRNNGGHMPLNLAVSVQDNGRFQIAIEDDGVGLDSALPQPEPGHGLALHSALMTVIGGELSLESEPGRFTRVTFTLPPNQ